MRGQVLDTVAYGGLLCSKACVGLLLVDWICRLLDHGFLASGVYLLVGKAGLEACAGFLMGGAGACPLMSRAGSWPSGAQGHVRGCV